MSVNISVGVLKYDYIEYCFNKQNEVCAILDWELSTIGHPFMDLAYLCMFYHAPDEYFLINDPTGNFRFLYLITKSTTHNEHNVVINNYSINFN